MYAGARHVAIRLVAVAPGDPAYNAVALEQVLVCEEDASVCTNDVARQTGCFLLRQDSP